MQLDYALLYPSSVLKESQSPYGAKWLATIRAYVERAHVPEEESQSPYGAK